MNRMALQLAPRNANVQCAQTTNVSPVPTRGDHPFPYPFPTKSQWMKPQCLAMCWL